MTEDKDRLRSDQWSDYHDLASGFRCQMPTELESERQGIFRIFRQDCSHKINSTFEVRSQGGDLLERFETLKAAKHNAGERHIIYLNQKQKI